MNHDDSYTSVVLGMMAETTVSTSRYLSHNSRSCPACPDLRISIELEALGYGFDIIYLRRKTHRRDCQLATKVLGMHYLQ